MKIILAFMLIYSLGCLEKFESSKEIPLPIVERPLPKLNTERETFASCRELQAHIDEIQAYKNYEYNRYYRYLEHQPHVVSAQLGSPETPSQPSSPHSEQDQQEAGVGELDLLSVIDNTFYYLNKSHLKVFKLSHHQKGLISLQNIEGFNFDKGRLIATSNLIFVIGENYNYIAPNHLLPPDDEIIYPNTPQIEIHPFSILSDGTLVALKPTSYAGSLIDVRAIGDQVILVSHNREADLESEELCQNTYNQAITDLETSHTVVTKLSFKNGLLQMKQQGVLGKADDLYMTKEALYLLSKGLHWFYWDRRLQSDSLYNSTLLQKFNIDATNIEYSASGVVSGSYKDRWAFKELDSHHVALALTNNDWRQSQKTNDFYILKELDHTYHTLSSIRDIAPTEDIRSVRFQEGWAYIVTFKKTDPLFVIDIHDFANPKIVSELKAPGFSTYLKPFGENRLLGIGFGAIEQGSFAWFDGIQVSKVNLALPETPLLEKQIQLGYRGSISDATHDHRSVYLDERLGRIGLPVIEREAGNSAWEYRKIDRTGFAIIDFENDLEEIDFISHQEWIPEECFRREEQNWNWWSFKSETFDINRLYRVGNRYISLSRFGAKLHDLKFEELDQWEFKEDETQCEDTYLVW